MVNQGKCAKGINTLYCLLNITYISGEAITGIPEDEVASRDDENCDAQQARLK
jgi:hypothetical protein